MELNEQITAELKVDLQNKKEQIEKELSNFAKKNENGEFTSNFPEDLGSEQSENANEVEEYADRLGVEKSLESQLTDINDALERMENGTYGKDVETGESIPLERLRAYPAARTNVK